MKRKQTCPDCGNAPVPHLMHKLSVITGTLLMRLGGANRAMDSFESWVNRFADRNFPHVFRALARAGLGTIIKRPDASMNMREQVFWEEGVRRGIALWAYRPFPKAIAITVAAYGGKTIVYDTIPRPNSAPSSGSRWMDDKEMCHRMFGARGIPMARGRAVRTHRQAQALFRTLTPPVIVKPSRGSRSRHTTTHIETPAELTVAFKKAKQLSPWIIIEEELEGFVHRGTVIGGRVIGILRREPALVIGDGTHSVEELIRIENENPKRKGPVFHTIEIHDAEHDKELARQGFTLSSVPKKGEEVTLSQKASRGLGGGATDVTDDAHPDTIALLEKVASVLEDPLVGIDFIIGDVRKSWKAQPRAGIIECNSAPFIDLHLYPLTGMPRNTPGALWELIFPDLARM